MKCLLPFPAAAQARDQDVDFVELCGLPTMALKMCTDKHPEYYGERAPPRPAAAPPLLPVLPTGLPWLPDLADRGHVRTRGSRWRWWRGGRGGRPSAAASSRRHRGEWMNVKFHPVPKKYLP